MMQFYFRIKMCFEQLTMCQKYFLSRGPVRPASPIIPSAPIRLRHASPPQRPGNAARKCREDAQGGDASELRGVTYSTTKSITEHS